MDPSREANYIYYAHLTAEFLQITVTWVLNDMAWLQTAFARTGVAWIAPVRATPPQVSVFAEYFLYPQPEWHKGC